MAVALRLRFVLPLLFVVLDGAFHSVKLSRSHRGACEDECRKGACSANEH